MKSDTAWTSAEDIAASVLKLWDRGSILRAKLAGEPVFPLRLPVRGPDNPALSARFGEVQTWVQALEAASRSGCGFGFDLVWREVRHRQIGRNRVPDAAILRTEADALQLIGKQAAANRFDTIAAATAAVFPELKPWLARKPLLALQHAGDWPRVLAVIAWFRDNPRSGLYLRQVDIPHVDTKFIEMRRGLLAELLDIVLARDLLEPAVGAPLSFERRYGLRGKPTMVRFRLLGAMAGLAGLTDISTPIEEFARLNLNPRIVLITENEVNGLAFPPVNDAMVVFGFGYGLDVLAAAEWLHRSRLVYWGDIDTHGFAILARLRAYFSEVESILMDETTLLAHRHLWVDEKQPVSGKLQRLTEAEGRLFDDLKGHRFGDRVRLEQERIAYRSLLTALHDREF
jgi:hypothetical protein